MVAECQELEDQRYFLLRDHRLTVQWCRKEEHSSPPHVSLHSAALRRLKLYSTGRRHRRVLSGLTAVVHAARRTCRGRRTSRRLLSSLWISGQKIEESKKLSCLYHIDTGDQKVASPPLKTRPIATTGNRHKNDPLLQVWRWWWMVEGRSTFMYSQWKCWLSYE